MSNWNKKIEHPTYGDVLLIKDRDDRLFWITFFFKVGDEMYNFDSLTLTNEEVRDALFDSIDLDFIKTLFEQLNIE